MPPSFLLEIATFLSGHQCDDDHSVTLSSSILTFFVSRSIQTPSRLNSRPPDRISETKTISAQNIINIKNLYNLTLSILT